MSSQSSQGSIPKAKGKRPSLPLAEPKTIAVPPQHPHALADPYHGEPASSEENIPPNPLALMTPPSSPTHATTTFDEQYHASLQTRVAMIPPAGQPSVLASASSSSSSSSSSSTSSLTAQSSSSSSLSLHAKSSRNHHHKQRSSPHRRRSFQLGSYPESTAAAWSDVSSTVSAPASSTPSMLTRPSPSYKFARPLSMRWEDYEDWEREDAETALYQAADDDPEHTIQSLDLRSLDNYTGLNRFGRPHQRHLRYDLDFSEMAAYQRRFEGAHDANLDSDQTGILDAYRESVGEQVAKARRAMEKNRQILQSFEEELEAVQLSIDKNMEGCNAARTAVEENFWKLEDLALNLEKDRQEISKQIQTVSRDGTQAVEAVSGWQVRIDWLGQQVDNTSSYVSELVLSEQECMSFVRMLVYQNHQHAGAPLISYAVRQRIESAAPPRPISKPAIPDSPSSTTTTTTTTTAIVETATSMSEGSDRSKGKQRADSPSPAPSIAAIATPPLPPLSPLSPQQQDMTVPLHVRLSANDLSRDFSRLTVALEQRQARPTYSLFRRARSNSTGGSGVGAYHPAQLRRPFVAFPRGHQAYAQAQTQAQLQSNGRQSPSSSSKSSADNTRPLSMHEKAGTLPQLDNLTGLPKVIPLATFDAPTIPVPVAKAANVRMKRVTTASLPPVPMHSWIRFQFNKIVGSRSSKPVVIYMATKTPNR